MMQFLRSLNIRTKLIIIILLMAILFLFGGIILLDSSFNNLNRRLGQQRVREEVAVIQRHLDEFEADLLATTKTLAATPYLAQAITNGDQAQIEALMPPTISNFPFDEIAIIDMTGNRLLPETGELENQGEDELITLALQGVEQKTLTLKKLDTGSELRLSAGVPIKNSAGEIVGGIIASCRIDDDFLAELNFARTQIHLVLVHEDIPVAHHILHAEAENHLEVELEEVPADLINKAAVAQALSGQVVILDDFVQLDVHQAEHSVAYMPLKIGDDIKSVVVILFNLAELNAFQEQITGTFPLVFALLSIVIIGGLSLFAQQSIISPLRQLSRAAQLMAAGDLSARADLESADEVGRLGYSFNRMAHQLQTSFTELTNLNAELSQHRDHLEGLVAERAADLAQTIAEHEQTEEVLRQTNSNLQRRLNELAALNRINQTLTAALDFTHMLETVSKELVELFDADTSGVGLLNEEQTELRIVAEYTRLPDADSAVGLVFPLTENPFTIQIMKERRPGMLCSADINPVILNTSEILNERQVQCIMILPLLARGQVIGTIGVDTTQPGREFTSTDLALAETVAGQMAGTIELRRLVETEQRQRQVAESLREVSIALNSSLNRGTVLNIIFEQLEKVMQYDGGGLFLQDGDELELINGWNLSRQFIGRRLPLTGRSTLTQPLKQKEVALIGDVRQHPDWLPWSGGEKIRAWMGAPLITPKKTIGLLTLDNFTINAYSSEDAQTFQLFANQAALAIQNAQLYAAAQQEIAERRQAQIALAEARDAALAASQFKSELLAKVSHELRTPLNAILGYAEMLQAGIYGPLSKKQVTSLTEIVESGEYLTRIINELLDQAQIEAGRITLKSLPFTPADIIDHIKEPMRMLAQAKGLAFTVDIAEDLPNLLIGDPTRLKQIVTNLVANAIKFTETGAVSVHLYQTDATQWAIRVSDTGPGIPTEAQAHVFEPFRQVDGSMTRQHSGTGLGLSIAKQLTEIMGGQITLDSDVGQGSIFTVRLPLSQAVKETVV